MSVAGLILDYRGAVDFAALDAILNKLKGKREFKLLNKTTAKRLYSITVECLENISRHSEMHLANHPEMQAHLTISGTNDKIVIVAGNTVTENERMNLTSRIDHVNSLDSALLQELYETKLINEFEGNDRCAGIGFIYMVLKSGNKIDYRFSQLINGYLYFEIKITLNQFIMRKLIIEPRSSSPEVILDPENKIYMISGESRPPDVREFYEPVISWIDEFGSHLNKSPDKKEPVIFNFNFDYFNSSSGKSILDICKILAGLRSKGINIGINWHSEKEDYDMLEAGKEISRIVKFPFEFIEVEK
jgi:hypothetical protein